eukprot:scaffold100108_cov87-Phaeocystis_antarctica.AAC.1
MVLYYTPGYMLVLSTPWALERAADEGRHMVGSDAKVDTVSGEKSKWSSIRRREPFVGECPAPRPSAAPACTY